MLIIDQRKIAQPCNDMSCNLAAEEAKGKPMTSLSPASNSRFKIRVLRDAPGFGGDEVLACSLKARGSGGAKLTAEYFIQAAICSLAQAAARVAVGNHLHLAATSM